VFARGVGVPQILAVVGQIAGQEDHQGQLEQLGGLKVEAPCAQPQARPCTGRVDAQNDADQQQSQPGQQPGVPVAAQPAHVDRQRADGQHHQDAQQQPDRLPPGEVRRQPLDSEQPPAAQEHGDGENERIPLGQDTIERMMAEGSGRQPHHKQGQRPQIDHDNAQTHGRDQQKQPGQEQQIALPDEGIPGDSGESHGRRLPIRRSTCRRWATAAPGRQAG